MGQVRTKHIDIARYWGYENEPVCCWACGLPVRKVTGYDKIVEAKAGHKLERCHIVPEALGGKDEPSNLYLLCPECHTLSPDTINPDTFFRWVKRRQHDMDFGKPSVGKIIEWIREDLIDRNIDIPLEDIADVIVNEINSDDMKAYLRTHIGAHLYHIADSSFVAGVTDYLISKYTTKVLDS